MLQKKHHIQNIQFVINEIMSKNFILLSFNELNFEYLKKYNQTGKLKILIKL